MPYLDLVLVFASSTWIQAQYCRDETTCVVSFLGFGIQLTIVVTVELHKYFCDNTMALLMRIQVTTY